MANATVIVTDKTGTITEGKMKIVSVYPGEQEDVVRKAALCLTEFALTPLDLEIANKAKESDPAPLPEIVHERGLGNGRKTKAIIRKQGDGYYLYKSGAPEEIFVSCQQVPEGAKKELDQQTRMAPGNWCSKQKNLRSGIAAAYCFP